MQLSSQEEKKRRIDSMNEAGERNNLVLVKLIRSPGPRQFGASGGAKGRGPDATRSRRVAPAKS